MWVYMSQHGLQLTAAGCTPWLKALHEAGKHPELLAVLDAALDADMVTSA